MSTPKRLAEDATKLLASEYGEHLMQWMSTRYNSLHQAAEVLTLSSEQKAFYVERAAGIKEVIDHLLTQKELLEQGMFDKPDTPPSRQ